MQVSARAMLPSTSVISFTLGRGLSFTTFVNTVPLDGQRTINRFALVRRLDVDPIGAGVFNSPIWDHLARQAMLKYAPPRWPACLCSSAAAARAAPSAGWSSTWCRPGMGGRCCRCRSTPAWRGLLSGTCPHRILGEDKVMVEQLKPQALKREISVKADLVQIAFRKLREEYLVRRWLACPASPALWQRTRCCRLACLTCF